MLGGPPALEGKVLDSGDVVQVPLKQRQVGRGSNQGMVISAVGHREWDLSRTDYAQDSF